jgi:hypothetical protein
MLMFSIDNRSNPAPQPARPMNPDLAWFAARPGETFCTRDPLPGEFALADLRSGRGAPVVFCIATRDLCGDVVRVLRLLRFRLPARTGRAHAHIKRIAEQASGRKVGIVYLEGGR